MKSLYERQPREPREITPHTNNMKKDKARTPAVTRRWPFEFDIEYTHGQRVTYRARPMSERDGQGGIIGIRSLGGERFAVASYAASSKLKKSFVLCQVRGIES